MVEISNFWYFFSGDLQTLVTASEGVLNSGESWVMSGVPHPLTGTASHVDSMGESFQDYSRIQDFEADFP